MSSKNLSANRMTNLSGSSQNIAVSRSSDQHTSSNAMQQSSNANNNRNRTNSSGMKGMSTGSSSNITSRSDQMLSVQCAQPMKSSSSLFDTSAFSAMLNEDLTNICSLDNMDLLSSPRQKSIFSPEWNDKSNSMMSNNENSLLSNLDHGSNGSDHSKQSTVSPTNKRAIIGDELNIKKEQQQMHRTSATAQMDKSMKMKRDSITISGMQYDKTLPPNLIDTKAVKRPFADALDQIDPSDYAYRETKLRKTDIISPTNAASLLDSKPNVGGAKGAFGVALNGIETNPDLVSSLLKESLSDTKFGTLDQKKMPSTVGQDPNAMTNYNAMQQQLYDQQQAIVPIAKVESFDSHPAVTMDRSQRSINQYGSQHHVQQHDQHQKHHQQQKQHKDMEQMQQYGKVKPDAAMFHEPSQLQQHLQQPSQLPQTQIMPQQQQAQQQRQQQPPHYHQQPHQVAHQFQDSHHQHQPSHQPHQLQQQQQQQQQLLQQQHLLAQPLPAELCYSDQEKHHDKKKKKKEKHKNKDKEKSKNREERKKHKKDKDRSKDKSKSHHGNHSSNDEKHDAHNSSMQRAQTTDASGYVYYFCLCSLHFNCRRTPAMNSLCL